MIRLQDCEFLQWRSSENEPEFFANMGKFFASAFVRRECGGYPLNDNGFYRWFIVRCRRSARVLGFISLEQRSDVAFLRNGYMRTEARGQGLFQKLLQQVMAYVDQNGLECRTRMPQITAKHLTSYGFRIQSTRGAWVSLVRKLPCQQ